MNALRHCKRRLNESIAEYGSRFKRLCVAACDSVDSPIALNNWVSGLYPEALVTKILQRMWEPGRELRTFDAILSQVLYLDAGLKYEQKSKSNSSSSRDEPSHKKRRVDDDNHRKKSNDSSQDSYCAYHRRYGHATEDCEKIKKLRRQEGRRDYSSNSNSSSNSSSSSSGASSSSRASSSHKNHKKKNNEKKNGDCEHCGEDGHKIDTCWIKNPHLREQYLKRKKNPKGTTHESPLSSPFDTDEKQTVTSPSTNASNNSLPFLDVLTCLPHPSLFAQMVQVNRSKLRLMQQEAMMILWHK